MINWKNMDECINENPRIIPELISQLKTEIKYERSYGLKGISSKELDNIKKFREFAKRNSIFSESHPILEDNLNLLEELKRIA